MILFQLNIHVRMTYRNALLYPWFFTLNPEHQVNLRLVHQYNAQDTHTTIQYQDTKVLIPYQYSHTVIQYQHPKIPILTDLPLQFFNSQTTKLIRPGKVGNPVLVRVRYTHSTNRSILTQFTTLLTNYH